MKLRISPLVVLCLAGMTSAQAGREASTVTNLLPNPGFEEAADAGPAGWTYDGPAARRAETWPDSGAHGGTRSIRFAAKTDHQRWESDLVPVRGGEPYRLEWWTELSGTIPWHWTTHTGLVGVRVTFYDVAGDRCGVFERRMRSIGTTDWAKAWVRFAPPAEATSCAVALVCEADIETDGVASFDDVSLAPIADRPAAPEGWGVLRGVIHVDGSDAPGDARVVVTAADGKRYAPAESYPFLDGTFHALAEPFEVALPPGPATVVVVHGFEYGVWRDTVDIRAGQATEIAPRLVRRWSMPAAGWYGGDAHVHLFFHRFSVHPQMVPATVMDIGRAEGLQWLSFKGEEKEAREFIEHGTPWRFPPTRSPEFIGEAGIEAVGDFHGHTYTVNARAIPSDGFPMKLIPWPMNFDMARDLAPRNGAIVYAHPYGGLQPDSVIAGMANPELLLIGREWPVDLALGQTPCFDLLRPESRNILGAELQDYYRMLNVGFRSGLSACTDAYVDQARTLPGAARTYAHAGELTWDALGAAHRRGATFVTNGPLVWFSVNGAQPGDDVSLARGGKVDVALRAVSNWGVIRAEIIVNGDVAGTVMPRADGEIRDTVSVTMPASGWIALRVFGPRPSDMPSRRRPRAGQGESGQLGQNQGRAAQRQGQTGQFAQRQGESGQFAHTSPVYVMVGGRPIRPDPDAARYFASWMDAYRTAVLTRADLFHNPNGTWSDEVKQQILDRIARAKAVYEQKAREGARR